MRDMSLRLSCILLGIIILSGCSSQEENRKLYLEKDVVTVETQLDRLDTALRHGKIRNAKLLTLYAKKLRLQKPDFIEIIDELALDSTSKGPIFQGLKSRLATSKSMIPTALKSDRKSESLSTEIMNVYRGSQLDIYGMMLTDPINVLADLSGGTLARVESMSKEASMASNKASDYGAGSQLIGNPNYGHWKQDSSGGSFWEWYGKYALFRDLVGGPRVYYGGWSSHRNYSYYNDWGRNYYTSPTQYSRQQSVEKKTRKKFTNSGKKFSSPYAKQKTGSSARVKSSSAFKSPSKFKSSYSRSGSSSSRSSSSSSSGGFKSSYSSRSSSSGSFRNSSRNTSRSYSSGK